MGRVGGEVFKKLKLVLQIHKLISQQPIGILTWGENKSCLELNFGSLGEVHEGGGGGWLRKKLKYVLQLQKLAYQ